eukprot:403372323
MSGINPLNTFQEAQKNVGQRFDADLQTKTGVQGAGSQTWKDQANQQFQYQKDQLQQQLGLGQQNIPQQQQNLSQQPGQYSQGTTGQYGTTGQEYGASGLYGQTTSTSGTYGQQQQPGYQSYTQGTQENISQQPYTTTSSAYQQDIGRTGLGGVSGTTYTSNQPGFQESTLPQKIGMTQSNAPGSQQYSTSTTSQQFPTSTTSQQQEGQYRSQQY